MLRIRLLGGLDVREGEEIVSLAESARARSLLAYRPDRGGGPL